MDAIRNRLCCSCRRRTLVSKIFPAILQVFVIIAVWQIFKSQTMTEDEAGDSSSRIQRSADFPNCSPGDYSNGKILHLDAIMSHANVLASSRDQQRTNFLSVEVFVRDVAQGSIILYPVGTPVTFGQGKGTHSDDEGTEIDYVEYPFNDGDEKADVNNEGENVNQLNNDKLNENANNVYDQEADAQIGDANEINSNQRNNGFEDEQYVMDYPQVGEEEHRDEHVIDEMLVNDQMLRIRPNEQRGQQTILDQIDGNGEGGNIAQDSPYQRGQMTGNNVVQMNQVGNQMFNNGHQRINIAQGPAINAMAGQHPGGHPFQALDKQQGSNNMFQQDNILRNPNMPPQQNIRALPAQEAENGYLQQVLQNGPQNPQSGLQNQRFPGQSQQGVRAPSTFQEQQGVGLNMGTAHTDDAGSLYAVGFPARVNKFKSELYGNTFEENILAGSTATQYNINNAQACQGKQKIDVLYLINSIPQSADVRQRIRETFANSTYFQPYTVVSMFLVGATTSPNFQSNINQEAQLFADIIQGNFPDTPENATLKGIMGFRWTKQFCPQAALVMKIDEDVFVDTDKLLRGLIPAIDKVISDKAILCSFNPEGPIPRSGPRAFKRNLFPNRTMLRPYCKGFAVLMTQTVVTSLLAASEHVPAVHMDDLYLYGILPFVVGDIDVYDLGNKRAFHDFGMDSVKCYTELKDTCPFVASKAFSGRFTALWDFVQSRLHSKGEGWENEKSLWDIESYKRKF